MLEPYEIAESKVEGLVLYTPSNARIPGQRVTIQLRVKDKQGQPRTVVFDLNATQLNEVRE